MQKDHTSPRRAESLRGVNVRNRQKDDPTEVSDILAKSPRGSTKQPREALFGLRRRAKARGKIQLTLRLMSPITF
jgi:hypothetical protein